MRSASIWTPPGIQNRQSGISGVSSGNAASINSQSTALGRLYVKSHRSCPRKEWGAHYVALMGEVASGTRIMVLFHKPQPYQLSLPAATAWQERFAKNRRWQISNSLKRPQNVRCKQPRAQLKSNNVVRIPPPKELVRFSLSCSPTVVLFYDPSETPNHQ